MAFRPNAKLENIESAGEHCKRCIMSMLKVDLDLVQKYNVAGPRYTSYPPATKFTDALTWPELAEQILREQPHRARPLALFSHPVLRDALLVLRLHHCHHPQPQPGAALISITSKKKWRR